MLRGADGTGHHLTAAFLMAIFTPSHIAIHSNAMNQGIKQKLHKKSHDNIIAILGGHRKCLSDSVRTTTQDPKNFSSECVSCILLIMLKGAADTGHHLASDFATNKFTPTHPPMPSKAKNGGTQQLKCLWCHQKWLCCLGPRSQTLQAE